MSDMPVGGVLGAEAPPRAYRLLVLANEMCASEPLYEAIRLRGRARPADTLVVAPALTSKVRYWLSDEDGGIERAAQRLTETVARAEAAGIRLRGQVGDPDPLQALDDATRAFDPDEIIVVTHPADRSNWLERGLVAQARARFDVPVTHIVADVAGDVSTVVEDEEEDPRAPARERHRRRDLVLLVAVVALAAVGTAVSLLLFMASVPTWIAYAWVLVIDLGFKLAAVALLWRLFQGRPRADRLDF